MSYLDCNECHGTNVAGARPCPACGPERRLVGAKVPEAFLSCTREAWEASFGPWEKHSQLKKLVNWPSSDPADWLVMVYGEFGVGKSSLTTALFSQALEWADRTFTSEQKRGQPRSLWIDFNDWVDEMMAAFGNEGESDRIYLRARDAFILHIDDGGIIRGAEDPKKGAFWRQRTALLIRHRYNHRLRTIWNNNLISRETAERLRKPYTKMQLYPDGFEVIDGSLVGRMTTHLAIELTGGDLRKKKALK